MGNLNKIRARVLLNTPTEMWRICWLQTLLRTKVVMIKNIKNIDVTENKLM
jgi:hypothetical protein